MSDMRMGGKHSSTKAVGRKLGHEMLELGLIFAYLYVCLGAIILYKVTILRGQGIDSRRTGWLPSRHFSWRSSYS